MKILRVLIVEDDAIIGLLLGETLAEMGHTVCALAASEDKAVLEAALHKPDLVIVDSHLHQGNGISALEKILRNGFVPHLFITGDRRSVQAEFPDARILAKPFFDVELMPAIEGALAGVAGKTRQTIHDLPGRSISSRHAPG
jgi:CheY-like chemotaxis protein